MAISSVLAVGLAAQSIFIGGNIYISGIFIPSIRHNDSSPKQQISQWKSMFEGASKLMPTSALLAFACYAYEAYQATPGSDARIAFIISAATSILVVPFTISFMLLSIKNLMHFMTLKTDEELADKDVSYWIGHWNHLSIARLLIFSAGFVNTLSLSVRN